jgi:hypothetical protein
MINPIVIMLTSYRSISFAVMNIITLLIDALFALLKTINIREKLIFLSQMLLSQQAPNLPQK